MIDLNKIYLDGYSITETFTLCKIIFQCKGKAAESISNDHDYDMLNLVLTFLYEDQNAVNSPLLDKILNESCFIICYHSM